MLSWDIAHKTIIKVLYRLPPRVSVLEHVKKYLAQKTSRLQILQVEIHIYYTTGLENTTPHTSFKMRQRRA